MLVHEIEQRVLTAARACFGRGEHEGVSIAREARLPIEDTEWWLEKLDRRGLVRQYLTDPEPGDPHTHWAPVR